LTGRESEPCEVIYFKLYKTQIPVVEQAIETAALMLARQLARLLPGDDMRGLLAGAKLNNEDPTRPSLRAAIVRIPLLTCPYVTYRYSASPISLGHSKYVWCLDQCYASKFWRIFFYYLN